MIISVIIANCRFPTKPGGEFFCGQACADILSREPVHKRNYKIIFVRINQIILHSFQIYHLMAPARGGLGFRM